MKKHLLLFTLLISVFITGCAGDTATEQSPDLPAGLEQIAAQEPAEPNPEPASVEGEISVCVFQRFEFYDIAANMFMEKYPDVTVTINSYLDDSRDETGRYVPENYRYLLNTKIMSGSADDVISMSVLPVARYCEMGVFEDITPFLAGSQEIDGQNYFMNVIESAKYFGGGQYVLPISFNFDAVGFDGELIEESGGFDLEEAAVISYKDALAYAKRLKDASAKENVHMALIDCASYLNLSFADYYKDLIDLERKQAHFDSEIFLSLLNGAEALSNGGYFQDWNSFDFYNTKFWMALTRGRAPEVAANNLNPDYPSVSHALPLSDIHGNVYAESEGFALNSKSENKTSAWEFMKFLISDEVQSLPSFIFAGVNRNGFDAFAQRQYELYDSGTDYELSFSAEDYKLLLEQWASQINAYNDGSQSIFSDILFEENKNFADGNQTAQETARKLQTKITQYLNE